MQLKPNQTAKHVSDLQTAYARSFVNAVTRILFMINRQKSVSSNYPAQQHPTSDERVVNIYTTQYIFFSKNSLIINTTNNLAKLKEMLRNPFNLSSLMNKQPVKESWMI